MSWHGTNLKLQVLGERCGLDVLPAVSGIEPGTAGPVARELPLCHAIFPITVDALGDESLSRWRSNTIFQEFEKSFEANENFPIKIFDAQINF